MDFDSHTSDVVTAAVRAVNVLTPGHDRGRPFPADEPRRVLDVLVPRAHQRHESDVDDAEIAALRHWTDWLYTVFAAVDTGERDAACLTLNALITDTGAVPLLARHSGEPWHLHFHSADAGWGRSWAASMCTALAVVLGNPALWDRPGVCSAASCDRVFVDVSRNGTRRFCSTSCQNRVKAAAFRARRRTGTAEADI